MTWLVGSGGLSYLKQLFNQPRPQRHMAARPIKIAGSLALQVVISCMSCDNIIQLQAARLFSRNNASVSGAAAASSHERNWH